MGLIDWIRKRRQPVETLDAVLHSTIEKVLVRGPFPKCGGCGTESPDLRLIRDKKSNSGYLCLACSSKYKGLLQPDSPRNFWMCGVCGYRVLAGTQIDSSVDQAGNACPNCRSDVNISLVNLNCDRPVGRGLVGEPVE